MITIKAFWQKVQTQLKANNPVILAMVMEKKGSAPRGWVHICLFYLMAQQWIQLVVVL